jgi:hypothetical protein
MEPPNVSTLTLHVIPKDDFHPINDAFAIKPTHLNDALFLQYKELLVHIGTN